ncbi:hypothetical protein Pcinc_041525 [Petrolisthes cinctipes]|uniref:Uncharacterized protein n=1 Tax=Petrolisthes cinctipes TaxID=88211 RepID=A0AAE1BLW2_PETCI|nr:hypothetical protein Pcinc_041525 [Petrolisthes cinctipes]
MKPALPEKPAIASKPPPTAATDSRQPPPSEKAVRQFTDTEAGNVEGAKTGVLGKFVWPPQSAATPAATPAAASTTAAAPPAAATSTPAAVTAATPTPAAGDSTNL